MKPSGKSPERGKVVEVIDDILKSGRAHGVQKLTCTFEVSLGNRMIPVGITATYSADTVDDRQVNMFEDLFDSP